MAVLRAALLVLPAVLVGCACGQSRQEMEAYGAAWRAEESAFTAMIDSGDYESATTRLIELWMRATGPNPPRGIVGYYGNYLTPIECVAHADAGSRERFIVLERSTVPRPRSRAQEYNAWLDLNRVLADDHTLVELVEKRLGDPVARERLGWTFTRDGVFGRLIDAGRWDLAGQLYEDPVETFFPERHGPTLNDAVFVLFSPVLAPLAYRVAPRVQGAESAPPSSEEEVSARKTASAARLAAALHAAGREDEIGRLREKANGWVGEPAAGEAFDRERRRAEADLERARAM